MEENSLEQKIKKQRDLIQQSLNNFKKSFETKNLKHNNFIPYLEAINYAFDLNNSYGQDYFEFISKKQLEFLFANNRILMKDICTKLKSLSKNFQKQKEKNSFLKKPQKVAICKVCNLNIQSRNIQQAKNDVEDTGMSSLKKMLQKIQEQNNISLFTADQDKRFFKELNRVLNKKEQILAITDNHLENYLEDIMKNLKEIKYLQDIRDTSFILPQSINWQTKIKGQLNSVLLNSFKGKVPPWIQKMFDQFAKIYTKLIRKLKQSKSCQTDPYTQDEVFELKKIIQDFKEQQKGSKTINQDYSKQIQALSEKLRNCEIENTILKDRVFSKDFILSKASMSNSKQLRSLRNSSLKNFSQTDSHPNNQPTKLSKFKSRISNSFHDNENQKIKILQSQSNYSIQENKQNIKQNTQKIDSIEPQVRDQHSITEHLNASSSNKVKRHKNKKFTDIQYFKKLNSNPTSQGFLPSLKHVLKNAAQKELLKVNNSNQIKKTSIRQDYSIKLSKVQDKIERFQLPSFDLRNEQSRSIIQVEQNNQKDLSQSQMNLSQSQRQIRVKKYKQTVSDIQSQLEMKIQNIQVLKKNMIKKNSLLSMKSKNKELQLFERAKQFGRNSETNFQQRSQMNIYSLKNVNEYVQTDTSDKMVKERNSKEIQIKKLKDSSNKDNQCKSVQIQTQKSHLELIKRFQKNQNLAQISDEHFEKIMNKILQRTNKTTSLNSKTTKREIQIQQCIEKKQRAQSISTQSPKNSKFASIQRYSKEKSFHSKEKCLSKSNFIYKTNGSIQIKQNPNELALNKLNQNDISPNKGQACLKSVFTKRDFTLFLNEQNSYKYETNLKKKYHKIPSCQLTTDQVIHFTSVYGMIQVIKSNSLQFYNQIISFIKYPYQTVVNDFSILNIVKDMCLESFLWYTTRIKYYHLKCNHSKKDDNKSICDHVQKFIEKIQNLFIEATFQVQSSVPENQIPAIQAT